MVKEVINANGIEEKGRPVYSYTENYHVFLITNEEIRNKILTEGRGLEFAAKSAEYRYVEKGTGVLFKMC